MQTPSAKKGKAHQTVVPAVADEKIKAKEEVKSKELEAAAEEVELSENENESQTIKEKKENAKRMLKAVKAFNAKLKSSIERKDISRAVQAL